MANKQPPPRTQTAESRFSRPAEFAKAFHAGELDSILVVGDSISDGNCDTGCLYSSEERADENCRVIMTDETGETYYENRLGAQGWVKHFRAAAQAVGVETFHNAAIDGKSAKWYNTHKELLFSAEQPFYDAIFVMLGTNDRWDCADMEEFHTVYEELLSYLDEHCDYLTVLVPIPALSGTQQVAEEVCSLCEECGYTYIDCYHDFPQYAADHDIPLGSLYWGGTHPNQTGYLALWDTIIAPPAAIAEPEDVASIHDVGYNLDTLTGDTSANAVDEDGVLFYPEGVSWYYTWFEFTEKLPHGAFIETHREADGSVTQFAYGTPFNNTSDSGFAYVRTWQEDHWSGWSDIS